MMLLYTLQILCSCAKIYHYITPNILKTIVIFLNTALFLSNSRQVLQLRNVETTKTKKLSDVDSLDKFKQCTVTASYLCFSRKQ